MTDSHIKVARYTGIVMFATLLCRILGLGREMVISNKFGAGFETDAFFIAFMIPNLLRSFLGEGALNTTFIPVFSDYLTQHDQKKADRFASNVLNILLVVLGIVTVLGIWGSPLIVNLVAGGFKYEIEKYLLTVRLTRMVFPYIGFAAIAALFMAILNSYKEFFIPAFAPAMLNIGIIYFAILQTEKMGIFSLAVGVLIGGFVQAVIHIPSLKSKKFHYQLIIDFTDPGIKTLFTLLIPAIIGLAIDKINFIVDRIIASYLAHGSISALYYANRLMQFPLGVFGIALSIAILPTLSRQMAENKIEQVRNTFSFGIKILSFFTLPSTVGLIVLSHPIIQLFYEHGLFSSKDTRLTEVALICYTVGLFATATLRLVVSTFYAMKDTKTPLKIGLYVVFFNIIFDLLFVRWMAHAGIALATSIAAILHLFILGIALNRKIKRILTKDLIIFLLKITSSSFCMGFACLGVCRLFTCNFNIETKLMQIYLVGTSIIFGFLVYLFSGIMLGISEFRNAGKIIHRLIKGKIDE